MDALVHKQGLAWGRSGAGGAGGQGAAEHDVSENDAGFAGVGGGVGGVSGGGVGSQRLGAGDGRMVVGSQTQPVDPGAVVLC